MVKTERKFAGNTVRRCAADGEGGKRPVAILGVPLNGILTHLGRGRRSLPSSSVTLCRQASSRVYGNREEHLSKSTRSQITEGCYHVSRTAALPITTQTHRQTAPVPNREARGTNLAGYAQLHCSLRCQHRCLRCQCRMPHCNLSSNGGQHVLCTDQGLHPDLHVIVLETQLHNAEKWHIILGSPFALARVSGRRTARHSVTTQRSAIDLRPRPSPSPAFQADARPVIPSRERVVPTQLESELQNRGGLSGPLLSSAAPRTAVHSI
jgi:hypothetical protein